MRQLVPLVAVLLLASCSDSHRGDPDGGGSDGGALLDAAVIADAGRIECADVAEGDPCGAGDEFCRAECDPCSFCNVLQCTGGEWMRIEAHPPPPEACFDCGEGGLRCLRGSFYCQHAVSDVSGVPDSYVCRDVPADCSPVTCDCVSDAGTTCTDDGAQGVVVTLPGG